MNSLCSSWICRPFITPESFDSRRSITAYSREIKNSKRKISCCLRIHDAEGIQLSSSSKVFGIMLAATEFDSADTAEVAIKIVGPFLSILGFLFFARIVMSWFPNLPVGKFPLVIAYAPTEPLLVPTRKLIPAVGGVDITPVVWFGVVSFLSEILVGPQGILVLLSQHRVFSN